METMRTPRLRVGLKDGLNEEIEAPLGMIGDYWPLFGLSWFLGLVVVSSPETSADWLILGWQLMSRSHSSALHVSMSLKEETHELTPVCHHASLRRFRLLSAEGWEQGNPGCSGSIV